MPNIETNTLVSSLDTDIDKLISVIGNTATGKTILAKSLFRQAVGYNLDGVNTIRLLDSSDQGQFGVDNNGRYIIPPDTTLELPARPFIWLRDLAFTGKFTIRGQVEANNPTLMVQASGSGGAFLNSASCSRLFINNCLFTPLSFLPAFTGIGGPPAPSGTLFNIDNGTTPANWGDICFCHELLIYGFNSLGIVGGFQFEYFRELVTEYCVNGITLQNYLLLPILAHEWKNGLANGTVLTLDKGRNTVSLFFLYDLNPNEKAFNFISNASLETIKLGTSQYRGTTAQAFALGSLTQADPRVLIEGCAPLAPSNARAHIIGASATLTVPTINDFHPTTSVLSLGSGGAERFVIEGSGAAQRIKYIGLTEESFQIDIQSAKTGSTGSVILGTGYGKNTGDTSIPATDTTNWNAINSTVLPTAAGTQNNVSASGTVQMTTNDYLKIYDQSSTTANVALAKHIVNIAKIG